MTDQEKIKDLEGKLSHALIRITDGAARAVRSTFIETCHHQNKQ
jgi:hypothetical protein